MSQPGNQWHGRSWAVIATCGLLASSLALGLGPAGAPPVHADPGESQVPIANPDLTKACGIDINVVLDESGSVGDAKSDVQTAFRAFTSALKNTGSRLAVSEFSTVARLPLAGAARSTYSVVTDDTIASTFEPYIAGNYRPDGTTDWEDGLRVSRYMLPRPSPVQPHLVVFITDGDPNRIVKNTVSTSDYHTKVPLSENQVTDSSENSAANAAVPNANGLKAGGSHVLALAVGSGLDDSGSLSRLKKISGPDVFPSQTVPEFDISTTDVYKEADFSKLEQALRAAAFQLCSPSVTVRKLVDLTPDPNTDDAAPGAGFDFTAVTSPDPAEWVLPPGVTPPTSPTATTSTDANGFASFQWRTPTPTESRVTITEQDPSAGIGGYPPLAFDPASTQCSYRTPESPTDQPLATDPVTLGFAMTVPRDSIVTCTVVNRAPAQPGLTIQKSTNGIDADTPPGPALPAGDPITWTYVVSNTGNTTINELAVADAPSDPADPAPVVSCPGNSLAPGATMTCSATGTARPGQYENTATATGTDSLGAPVGAGDPSHYLGTAPSIDLEKATNSQDADDAPGPFLAVDDPVTWTYVVTNTGNSVLTGLSVVDDAQGVVLCPTTTALAPGASTTCTLTGTAVEGQYANNATATALTVSGVTVTDSDPSHYFGAAPGVDIEKSTNGEDADEAPGPNIPIGDDVIWAYVVTNTGNVPLTSWQVTDDKLTGILCPQSIIRPGDRVTCTANGTSSAGQYENTATVTASSALVPGVEVRDSDLSHYFGADPGIDIEKATNGFDGDSEPGIYLPVGAPVTWTYTVKNTGNVPVSNIVVVDDQGVSVLCPASVLPSGEQMLCSGTGTAQEGQYGNVATVTGTTSPGRDITDADPSHYFGAAPKITLEKSTNGEDADEAPGPIIPVGETVMWVYRVTNDGNVPLTDIEVTDDQGADVVCPDIEALLPQESLDCEAQGEAVPGQYENIGEVTATTPLNSSISAEDPSHYFGSDPSIDIEKATNGRDADLDPGIPGSDAPYIPVGGAVSWTYEVTNTGNTALSDLEVSDDQGVVVSCPGDTLAPGAQMTCTGSGTAAPGAYANHGTVIAVSDLDGTVIDDTDPSHYFGSDPRIDLEKFTNGEDADTAPGHSVPVEADVVWTYLVTNVGNAPLTEVRVADDRVTPVECPEMTNPLAPGDTITCTAAGKAAEGQYENLGSVAAVDPAGTPALGPQGSTETGDTDPSHYFGTSTAIDVEKATNGMDADLPAGEPGSDAPFVPVGEQVTWTYTIRNTGNAPLTDITLDDTVEGLITDCDSPLAGPLAPDAEIVCEATGIAMPGEYTNSATVMALGPDLREVSDNDPSNYFGASSALVVEKSTNGDDADDPPGSLIAVDSPVLWTYDVTNAGNVTLFDVTLTDRPDVPTDPSPVVGCPGDAGSGITLQPGETVTCTAAGSARLGQYGNEVTALGHDAFKREVRGSDPSHYFGFVSGIDVQKSTNGVDADSAPGPLVPVGGSVTWTYVVTNMGNIAIPDFTLSDSDAAASITCPPPDPNSDALPVGGSVTCTATGTATEGQYENTATVNAHDALEQSLRDTDPSHYLGVTVRIDIEKATNGEDSDQPPGPQITVGDPVTLTYVVTNTGTAPLASVAVTDDVLGLVPCPATTLEPGASMTCTLQGSAREGQYGSLGTVTGQVQPAEVAVQDPGGQVASDPVIVTDTDPSHFFAVAPALLIEKSPDHAEVEQGDPFTFTIKVTNTGGEPLTGVVVSDPQVPACDRLIGDLAPGASASYTCELAQVPADLTNVAQVTGNTTSGAVVTDDDNAQVVVTASALGSGGDKSEGDDGLVGTGADDPALLLLSALGLLILGAGMRLLGGRR